MPATISKVAELLNNIDLTEYSVFKATYSVQSAKEDYTAYNNFEETIGDTFEDTYNGDHLYSHFAAPVEVFNEITSNGKVTLSELVTGSDYSGAWIKLDLTMLSSDLVDEHDIDIDGNWFETNTYVVNSDGIATLQTNQ